MAQAAAEKTISPMESRLFRRARMSLFLSWFAIFPLMIAAQKFPWLWWPFGILIAQWIVAAQIVYFWDCPRCGRLFTVNFERFFPTNAPWTNHCMNCGSVLLRGEANRR
jgi:hypothetical protein